MAFLVGERGKERRELSSVLTNCAYGGVGSRTKGEGGSLRSLLMYRFSVFF